MCCVCVCTWYVHLSSHSANVGPHLCCMCVRQEAAHRSNFRHTAVLLPPKNDVWEQVLSELQACSTRHQLRLYVRAYWPTCTVHTYVCSWMYVYLVLAFVVCCIHFTLRTYVHICDCVPKHCEICDSGCKGIFLVWISAMYVRSYVCDKLLIKSNYWSPFSLLHFIPYVVCKCWTL